MPTLTDALRQAFMPPNSLNSPPFSKLQKPLTILTISSITLAIVISTSISLSVVFPSDASRRTFCGEEARIQKLLAGDDAEGDRFPGAFYLTDQETVDYFWMVVAVPSSAVFAASVLYLVAGMTVAYTAPTRHGCLKVVENNYCASKRGGVRCLSILNAIFAVVFGLLALFLGSTLLTLGSRCSVPLFWCYEIASWGLVCLYGGTAFFLRRKAATVLDESDFAGRNLGLEMLEANPVDVTPEVERRLNEGFKSWMGSSLLSSDEEDNPDDYLEAPQVVRSNSGRQRE